MLLSRTSRTSLYLLLTAALALSPFLAGCDELLGELQDDDPDVVELPDTDSPGTDTHSPDTDTPDPLPEECPENHVLSGNVSADTTWSPVVEGCPDWEVTGVMQITAHLTIEPGVRVRFADGAALRVTGNGALTAEGTEEAPIVLEGTEPDRGWWQGVAFQTERTLNRLRWVEIHHAGSAPQHNSVGPAGLLIGRSVAAGSARVDHVTVTLSGGAGVEVHGNSALESFSNNLLRDNEVGMRMFPRHFGSLDSTTTFENNSDDRIHVRDGSASDALNVPALAVAYRSDGFSAGEITIEAGARFEMTDGALIRIDGAVQMEGTEEAPIHFVGTTTEPGWWQGLAISNTTTVTNRVAWIVVEDAGSGAFHGSTEPAGVTLGRNLHPTRMTLEHLRASNNAGHGLYIHDNVELTSAAGLVLTGNEDAGASIPASAMRALDGSAVVEDNGRNTILVGGSVSQPGTWPALSVSWTVIADLEVRANVTIEPGARLEFGNARRIRVADSALTAVGTEEAPVVFAGVAPLPGSWRGVFVESSDGQTSTFEHFEIHHAGQDAHHGSVEPAGLTIGRSLNTASAEIREGRITDIGPVTNTNAAGIFVHSGSTANADVCSENVFESINGEDCVVQ